MTLEQRKGLRASDGDRDRVLVRLHTAYAEGRLTEAELDERIDLALAARTEDDLAEVSSDLPAAAAAPAPADRGPAGRFQLAYKSGVRRTGRWRLPEKYTTVIYKGHSLLDLRAAELDGPVTTIRVLAYKSTVEVIVPPGVRVETGGMGVSADLHGAPGADAPVVHIQGFAYKGEIEAKDRIRPA
ncbi:DUF1707 SHOCT-like domain-containing protein [Actinomadura montaniterrae]|uniref:DUF1707 domain-containing protein n=1 Tax=Actinomadura montaniterrae TaxID=1803903 RepID=A0A6L3VNM2_9ACTN|nr:DUF1707 domain-containing protein [Actinomadura montaniterrae]KAB2370660.1 DUF1707 domain-containing protein [Actinomadura montaniterrae]KAB2371498.1 DUF1707 domain-containing protein [Actinomadura montaniterrae]